MTEQEIQQCFGVKRNSTVPIYRQLRERFFAFISEYPAGTRFPSERDLSSALHISRKSIKSAVEALAQEKLILRNGRLGSFTNPAGAVIAATEEIPAAASEESFRQLHPLSFNRTVGNGSNAGTLKLLLFENQPCQRHFWEQTVEKFNRSGYGVAAEITWLPMEIRLSEVPEYAAGRDCELIQLSHYWQAGMEALQPLPDELQHRLADTGDTFADCFIDAPSELLQKLFPVYSTYWVLVANRSLLECGKTALSGRKDQFDRQELLQQVACGLKDGTFAFGSASELILSQGLKSGFHYEDLLSAFRRIREAGRTPRVFDPEPEEHGAGFLKGREALLFAWNSGWRWRATESGFPFDVQLLWPEAGRVATSAASYLGISCNCRRPRTAAMFLRFLLRDEIQKDIVRLLYAVPRRRSALPEFQALFPDYSLEECERFISLHRAFQYQPIPALLDLYLKGVFQQLAEGMLEPEEALAFAREQHICELPADFDPFRS